MATITVKLIGDDGLKRKLVGSRADAPVGRFLDRAAFTIQGAARKKAPVGVSGRLKNSIGTEKPSTRRRLVGPNVDYGAAVEEGSKPHLPPPGAVDSWAKKKGLDPVKVRWSIFHYGTEAHPYMQPAADESEEKIASLVSVLAAEIESAYQ